MAADAPAMLIDTAMETHGGTDWNYNPLENPSPITRFAADIENPISIDMFVQGALRPSTCTKRTRMLIDVHKDVPEVAN